MKKVVALFCACTLLLTMTTAALATGAPPPPTEGNPAPNNIASTQYQVGIMPMGMETLMLTSAANDLRLNSRGQVKMLTNTNTNLISDLIKNTLMLQRWNGSTWVNYVQVTISAETNFTLNTSSVRNVELGYYYRLQSTHAAYYGAQYKQLILTSDYLYID